MEKRLVISIILSLSVLYIWAGLTQRSRPQTDVTEFTQDIGIKEVNDTPIPQSSLQRDFLPKPESQEDTKEDFVEIDSEKLTIQFSNIGGKIESVYIKEYDSYLPIKNIGTISGYENVKFSLDNISKRTLRYIYEDQDVKLINTYQILRDEYVVKVDSYIQSKNESTNRLILRINGISLDMSRLDNKGKNRRDKSLFEYVINSYSGIHRKNNAYKFSEKENKDVSGHVEWTGYRDRYFCVIQKPEFETTGYEIRYRDNQNIDLKVLSEEIRVEGGVNFSSFIFIGPENLDLLKGYKLGLEKIKKFYRFGLFDIIAMAINSLMILLHKLIPNWGMCIILISIIIYFSMYPLTLRGMSSMKRMQAIQPEVAKLKEKYSKNPQKMNQEMMKMYKEYKINPIGGCLPFLLQMPIFIGLYQVLWRSVSFKGASFLWIKDLSEPDRMFILPFNAPLIGNEFNFLPILMMVVMALQQRISSKNMIVTDHAQRQQQKMMATIMPIFLGVIFYKFASGLTLYFTMFYIFSTITQYHMYTKKAA